MTSLPRPCLHCGRTIAAGSKCDACQAQAWAARGTTAERGYGAHWQRLVRAAINTQPYCSDCGHWGDNANPLTGDHLRWPALTLDDVAVVCRVCNSKRGAKRSKNLEQGTPHDPQQAEISDTHPLGVPGLA